MGKLSLSVVSIAIAALNISCGSAFDVASSQDNANSTSETTVITSSTYEVALGGVAKGRDEIVIADSTDHTLEFTADNDNIELQTSDSGAKIIPKKVGQTTVSYKIDGIEQEDKYKVIVPPQSLIQVLMGEARGQIEDEAEAGESPTGNAIGAVVRNRVLLIESGQPYSLFMVDENEWEANAPQSHWDAVILAENNGVYQFSPADPSTLSYDVFIASANRDDLIDDSEIVAYDQAVLTAAEIFDNEIADPTGGAFAFRTPTLAQSECLEEALKNGAPVLPDGCGPGDENFPAFAPVQILIHPAIAQLSDNRPSFVFYRNRSEDEPSVTNAP